jgi:Arc/MetJ-type ribon-helix-helix transcriptional regulator
MPTLSVNIPEPMQEFVDREVGSGRFRDASAFVQLLIAEAMETKETGFSEEEKERIDQLLLESLDSFDHGEHAPVGPGEFISSTRKRLQQRSNLAKQS